MKAVNHISRTFESISAIAGHLDSHEPQVEGWIIDGGSGQRPDKSWDHGMSLSDATEVCRKGGNWVEGGQNLKEVTLEMASMRRDGMAPIIENDVTGYLPDIDAFLAGDPCNMLSEGEGDDANGKIVKIGVHVFQSAMTSVEKKLNRGAAIMSCIDALEDAGYSIELWAVNTASSGTQSVDYRVLIKEAGQPWSPAAAAFGIIHPAFFRKVVFALAEREKGYDDYCKGQGIGYEPDGFDIVFPALLGSDSRWASTKEGALKHVTDKTNEYLRGEKQDDDER